MDFIENQYYHLYNRTNNEEALFRSRDNYIFFLKKYRYYFDDLFDTISYYLMQTFFFEFTESYNYLGSVQALTDINGDLLEEYAFDPWGKMRNPNDWEQFFDENNCLWFDYICYRGFTGHEHMPEFELINMKARVYDPVVGQFLSPDNNLTYPDYSQNYNKYSYALNNPLKFVDPSGEDPLTIAFLIYGALNVADTYIKYGNEAGNQALGMFAFNQLLNFAIPSAGTFGIAKGSWGALAYNVSTNILRDYILYGIASDGNFSKFSSSDVNWQGLALVIAPWGHGNVFDILGEENRNGDINGVTVVSEDLFDISKGLYQNREDVFSLYPNTDPDVLKRYLAIVCGEAGNSMLEAQGIGEVMFRRLDDEGDLFQGDFVSEIGGTSSFIAIGERIYNKVMNDDLQKILSPDYPFANRVTGAMNAYYAYLLNRIGLSYLYGGINVSNGAFFWNSSEYYDNFTSKDTKNNILIYRKIKSIGGTTFFKYNPEHPEFGGRTWP